MNYHYQSKKRKERTFSSPKTIKLILILYISHQFNTFLAQIGGGGWGVGCGRGGCGVGGVETLKKKKAPNTCLESHGTD